MIQQQKPGKRIVSKGRYVVMVGKKVVLSCSGLSLSLLGLVGLALSLVIAVLLSLEPSFITPIKLAILVAFVVLSAGIFAVGRRTLKKGVASDSVLPLTRANIGDLPAPDSLVRASSEPVQEQQAILLRAATKSEQTPMEQLVRPAGGCD